MSTFSGGYGPEEEDGAGWDGLVPTRAEREEEKRWERERQAKNYATTLAIALHAMHYPEVTQWKPLPDTLGLLTQIDNMVSGLVRERPCTCHPDDNPPKPCPKRYALSDCRAAAKTNTAPDFPFGGANSGGLTQCDMHDDESS